MLEVQRLVDERDRGLKVDGVREVDDVDALCSEDAVGLRGGWWPLQRP